MSIKFRLETVQNEIDSLVSKFDRLPGSVQLLAVSKQCEPEAIATMAALGQRAFGENYVNAALPKIEILKDLDLEWHFIGHIQSNKTRDIATNFAWVQSLDSLKIAQRLNDQRPQELPKLNVLIQVNIDNDPNKSGISPDELLDFVASITPLSRLNVRGLMVLPMQHPTESAQHQSFTHAHTLYQQCLARGYAFDTLSMGMSGDYEAAIACGSTMIRIGTALFGPRK